MPLEGEDPVVVEDNSVNSLTIRVSLEEYPDVSPIDTSFIAFKFKNCERQIVTTRFLSRNSPKIFTSVIGNPRIETNIDELQTENDLAFAIFGYPELVDEKYCGEVAFDVFNYDYQGEYLVGNQDWVELNKREGVPTESLIDRSSPLPNFISFGLDKYATISYGSKDEKDAGVHIFLMHAYLEDYPEALPLPTLDLN